MHISELAALTGVSQRSLRYYEGKGLITSTRLENGYRNFDPVQIDRVHAVQFYLNLGLTTDHIAQIASCNGKHRLPLHHDRCEGLLAVYECKLVEIDAQIASLQELQARLQKRIALFRAAQESATS